MSPWKQHDLIYKISYYDPYLSFYLVIAEFNLGLEALEQNLLSTSSLAYF